MGCKAAAAGSVADLPRFAPSQTEMTPLTASTVGPGRGSLGVGARPARGSMPQGRGSAEGWRAAEQAQGLGKATGTLQGGTALAPAHRKWGQRGASGRGGSWDLSLIWKGTPGLK